MTLKDTVKSILIMYPLISPSKLSVYSHLFLTIGNGYEWINGELVSSEDSENCTIEKGLEELFNDEYQYQLLESYLDMYISNFYDPKEFVSYLKRENKQKLKLVKRILNAENIVEEELHMSNEEEEILYPLCKYSAILNIPTDIKDDWKKGIEELYNYIMTSQEPKVVEYREKYNRELKTIENQYIN